MNSQQPIDDSEDILSQGEFDSDLDGAVGESSSEPRDEVAAGNEGGDTGDMGDMTAMSPGPVILVPLKGECTYQRWVPSDGAVGHDIALSASVGTASDGPTLNFVTAFDGTRGYVVSLDMASRFLDSHRESRLIMHGLPGLADSVRRATGADLCDWLDRGLLLDVQILYQLVTLAETGDVPEVSDFVHIATGTNAAAVFFAAQDLLGRAGRIAAACNAPAFQCLSQKFQAMGAFALDQVSKNGLHVDVAAVERIYWQHEETVQGLLDILRDEHGYWPGPGHDERYVKAVDREKYGSPQPWTGTAPGEGGFEVTYGRYEKLNRLLRQHIEPLRGHRVIHAQFRPLVNTGRTACSDPNVQGFPRDDVVRGLIVPSPGFLFLSADYRAIELCALAEICYQRFGQSKLRELINGGTDPHKWLASCITGKAIDGITSDERQKAKAVGFGFPGGMGTTSFCGYAEKTYGVTFTLEEAEAVKAKWMEALPEMKLYMQSSSPVAGWTGNPLGWPDDIAAATAARVLVGQPTKAATGERYPEGLINWVWRKARETEFPGKGRFLSDIERQAGSPGLRDAITLETVVWSSGRVRTGCSYCEARNNAFQGLVADGAKTALYRLVRDGFRVVNFIHDEFLVEFPEDADHLALARQVETVMVREMSKAIPHVTISVEYALMRRWCKSAKPVFDDPANPTKLLVWAPECVADAA
jgi:hypothetical protein